MNLPSTPATLLGAGVVGFGSALLAQIGGIGTPSELSGVSNIVGTGGLVGILVIIVRYVLKMYETKDAKLTEVLITLVVDQKQQNTMLIGLIGSMQESIKTLNSTMQQFRDDLEDRGNVA